MDADNLPVNIRTSILAMYFQCFRRMKYIGGLPDHNVHSQDDRISSFINSNRARIMVMNKLTHLIVPFFTTAVVLSSTQALAVVPTVDGKGVAAAATCTLAGAQVPVHHYDKIIFMVGGTLKAALTADQTALANLPLNTELDIKVRDNPRTVADLKGKVLTFLGATTDLQNRSLIKIIDVEYAVICAK